MTDLHNVESLVLEHLRHIRARVDQIADDVSDLKPRMSSVETGIKIESARLGKLPMKNISQVEHTRHHSITGFILNLLGALVAYTYQEKKPSLHRETAELQTLPAIV